METSFQFAKPISQVEIDINNTKRFNPPYPYLFVLKSCKRFFFLSTKILEHIVYQDCYFTNCE
jgi:hypothetical protein